MTSFKLSILLQKDTAIFGLISDSDLSYIWFFPLVENSDLIERVFVRSQFDFLVSNDFSALDLILDLMTFILSNSSSNDLFTFSPPKTNDEGSEHVNW